VKVVPNKASSVEETVQEIEKNLKTTFTKQILVTEREPSACQEDCPTVTYLLTPWSRVLLEKQTGLQLVKKFSTFYGTQRFITAFTSARHLS
jgi:hypothetical protein